MRTTGRINRANLPARWYIWLIIEHSIKFWLFSSSGYINSLENDSQRPFDDLLNSSVKSKSLAITETFLSQDYISAQILKSP